MKTDLLYRRDIVTELEKYLRTDDIVVLHGARQVGKTSILRYIEDGLKHKGEKTRYIDLEDSRYVKILDAGVDGLLGLLTEDGLYAPGQKPEKRVFVFIDEIQYLQNPSSFLKLVRDHHSGLKLLVSGSSSFAIKSKFRDSLVGRTVEFDVLPLSFREFLLFRNYSFEQSRVITEKKKDELKTLFREYALYGGYPRIVLTLEPDKKEKYLQQIVDTYVKKDIRDLGNVRDISKFNRLLEALASQSGNLLNVNELSGTTGIARQTVEHYLFIMENTYVIRLVRPYSRNIRMELFKLPKIFFYDTGLMQMLWLKRLQREIIGNVFETAIFSELAKKFGVDAVHYWRTKDKKEVDFILTLKDEVVPVEAKLNFGQFNPSAMDYFISRYGVHSRKVVGLNGTPKGADYIYPWDI